MLEEFERCAPGCPFSDRMQNVRSVNPLLGCKSAERAARILFQGNIDPLRYKWVGKSLLEKSGYSLPRVHWNALRNQVAHIALRVNPQADRAAHRVQELHRRREEFCLLPLSVSM